jgi:shikimate kinase
MSGAAEQGAQAAAVPGLSQSVVLVGLMGVGKSAIGRRLAPRLGLSFVDADAEIEAAAGCTIEEMFQRYGEAAFRDGERKVVLRLLGEKPAHVLATGGGAFMDPQVRAMIKSTAVSVWLRADIEVLLRRVGRRGSRPLLKHEDPRAVLTRLMNQRYPVYAEADIHIESADGPPEVTVERVLDGVTRFLRQRDGARVAT